jgi:hypothetical protein
MAGLRVFVVRTITGNHCLLEYINVQKMAREISGRYIEVY